MTDPFTVDLDGITFAIAQDDRELRSIIEVIHERPTWRSFRGCQRCCAACGETFLCKCCQSYKRSANGGGAVFYPEDGLRHVHLMTIAAFLAFAQQQRKSAA